MLKFMGVGVGDLLGIITIVLGVDVFFFEFVLSIFVFFIVLLLV